MWFCEKRNNLQICENSLSILRFGRWDRYSIEISGSINDGTSLCPCTTEDGYALTYVWYSPVPCRWMKLYSMVSGYCVFQCLRFTVTASGSLHIRDTVTDDGFARFYCQTVHRLTGEKRLSMPGQIIVSREWQRYVVVPLETSPVLLSLYMLVLCAPECPWADYPRCSLLWAFCRWLQLCRALIKK